MYLDLTNLSEEKKAELNKILGNGLTKVSIDRNLYKRLRFDELISLEAEDYIDEYVKENNIIIGENEKEELVYSILHLLEDYKEDAFLQPIKQATNIAYQNRRYEISEIGGVK